MAGKERVVSLSVKAKDDFSKVFKDLETAGRKAQLTFVRDTSKAVKDTQAEIRMLSIEIGQLSKASGDNSASIAKMTKEKAVLTAQASKLSTNLKKVLTSVRESSNGAKSGFASFSKLADSLARVDAAASKSARTTILREAAQARLNNQVKSGFSNWSQYVDTVNRVRTAEEAAIRTAERKAAIQERLDKPRVSGFASWSQSVGGLSSAGEKASIEALVPALNRKEAASKKAAAADHAHAAAMNASSAAARRMGKATGDLSDIQQRNKGKKGDEQEVEVYGLKPWQLTNLGYQVNDVISGLAMGQAPVQILAQQAGQFAQIWPEAMVSVARSIPQFAALAAVLTPVIASLSRAASESSALKTFASELALSADGARYSATALVDVAAAARNAGMAFDDAKKSLSIFVKEGVGQQNLGPLLDMARQLAKVTGESVPEAAARLGKAFSGGASDIRTLDREINFLTASQYEQVRAMDAAGDRTGAMAIAQGALNAKLEASKQPLSAMQRAVRDLRTAWNNLLTAFRGSWLEQDLQHGLDRIVAAAEVVGQVAAFVTGGTTAAPEQRADQLRAEIARARADQARDGAFQWGLYQGRIEEMEAELAQLATAQTATAEAAGDAADATEEQKKAAMEVDAVVQDQIKGLTESLDTTVMTSREQFIQNALMDARNAAMQKANELGVQFLGLTQQQTEALRSQAGALYDTQQSVDLQGNLGTYVNKVVGAESSGRTWIKNPESSATGLGQFITETWLRMFKQYFPDRAAGMTNAAILALRKDGEISKKMVELYAQENAKVLQRAGIAVTETSLYLSHFLGPNGAAGVMAAAASTPVSQILGADQINSNKSVLQGKNAGEVRAWGAKKMGITSVEVDVATRLGEIEADRTKEVDDYNEGYKERLADQQFELELARKTAREAAVAKAIRDEELEAQKVGLELTKEQRAETARVAGELFDRQNVDAEVNRLLEQRATIQERLSLAKASGDQGDVAAATAEMAELDIALTAAIDKAIAFWEAMGGEGAKVAIANLELHKQKVQQTADAYRTQFIPSAEELNTQIAETGGSALSTFAQQIAAGEASFKSLFAAVSAGIGQMLVEIGQAIMKQMILNAVSGGTAGGGMGGSINGWMMAAVKHDGGVAGAAGVTRMVDPAIFAGANRYHSGGIAGLKPNEVPAILEADEEVVTANDPRHRNNGGANQPPIKVVNVLDPAELLERALSSEVGERAILNFMSNRSQQINGVLS